MAPCFIPYTHQMNRICTLFLLIILSLSSFAQQVRSPRITPNGKVNAIVRSGDTTWIGGSFSKAGYYTSQLARFQQGSDLPDMAFPLVNGTIHAIEPDGSGGYFVGGNFSQANGVATHKNLFHILPNGQIDLNFVPRPNDKVLALAKSGDMLYVGGTFTQIDGRNLPNLARLNLNQNGAADNNWQPAPNQAVNTIALLPGGTVVAGGDFTQIQGKPQLRFARFAAQTGQLLPSRSFNQTVNSLARDDEHVFVGGEYTASGYFSNRATLVSATQDFPIGWMPEFNSTITDVIPDGQGGWFVAGSFTQFGSQAATRLVRIRPDFTLDPAFNPAPNNTVNRLFRDGNTLYVAGAFTQIGGAAQSFVAALNLNNQGALLAWDPQPNAQVYDILTAGNHVYLAGDFTRIQDKSLRYFGRVHKVTAQPDFIPSVSGTAKALAYSDPAIGGNGRVFIGGQFTASGYSTPFAAKANLSTQLPDPDFPVVNGGVNVVIPDGNGGWYMAGIFNQVNGQARTGIIHILPDNSIDPQFAAPTTGHVTTLLKDGNTLYAGGNFTVISGQAMNRIAAIDAQTGNLIPGWLGASAGVNSTVHALALFQGKLVIGGEFSQAMGQTRNFIAALDPQNGALDAFNPSANFHVFALASSPDRLFVGGNFANLAGTARNRMAAFDQNWTLDPNFNPNVNGAVRAIQVESGTLRIAGAFTQVGPQPRTRLAQINSTTGQATVFNVQVNGTILALAGDWIAGEFTEINGQIRAYVAKVNAAGQLEPFNARINHHVYTVAEQGNQLVLGGNFARYHHWEVQNVAVFDPATEAMDLSAVIQANGGVEDIEIRDAQYLYLGGSFTSINMRTRNRLAEIQYTVGPAFVTNWNPDLNARVQKITVVDDTVYVAGDFTLAGGLARNSVARITNANHQTAQVTTWNPQTNGAVNALGWHQGNLFMGGSFSLLHFRTDRGILALDENTGFAADFSIGANNSVTALELFNGALYVGGTFTQIGGQAQAGLAKFLLPPALAPVLDASWQPAIETGFSNRIRSLKVSGDELYAGGDFVRMAPGQEQPFLAAFRLLDGGLTTWNPMPDGVARAIARDGNDLVIGGDFTFMRSRPVTNLAAIDEVTGELLADLAPNPNNEVTSLALLDGFLYVGGQFTQFDGVGRNRLARIHTATGVTDLWHPNLSGSVRVIRAHQGNLFVGGDFTQAAGQVRNRLAAFGGNEMGLLFWDPNANGPVLDLLPIGSEMIVAGAFSQIGGQNRSFLARLDVNGQPTAWNPAPNGQVASVDMLNDRLYAGGTFNRIAGVNRRFAAAFSLNDGSLLDWDAKVNDHVSTVKARPDFVFIGGRFTEAGNLNASRGAIVTTGQGLLVRDLEASGPVLTFFDADSLLYMGGEFTFLANQNRARHLAIWELEGLTTGIDPDKPDKWADFEVYPNPAREVIYLRGETKPGEAARVRILRLDGTTLYDRQFSALPDQLNLPDMAAGMYLLQVNTREKSASRKLVIR